MEYRVMHSEKIFEGKVFDVRIDQVETPTHRKMRVDVVEHRGAVVLIPIDIEGRIWFVNQYRHATSQTLLELPAGTLDGDESPETCAVRECREEIGMAPGNLQSLGGGFLAPGYSTEFLHFFLATQLTPSPLAQDKHEDLQVQCLSWDETLERIHQRQLQDTKSLAGLFLAQLAQPALNP
jgi:ADP-ribose pyrophosphatase